MGRAHNARGPHHFVDLNFARRFQKGVSNWGVYIKTGSLQMNSVEHQRLRRRVRTYVSTNLRVFVPQRFGLLTVRLVLRSWWNKPRKKASGHDLSSYITELGLARKTGVLRLRPTYSHMKIGYVVSDKVPPILDVVSGFECRTPLTR